MQKSDLENRTGAPVDPGSNVFAWMVRHAVDLSNKRMAGADGLTPWQRMHGRPYRGQLLRFGVPVLHRHSGDTIGGVLMDRWSPGHWLGKTANSDEHIVALPNGNVIRVRTAREVDGPVRWDELKHVVPVSPGRMHTAGHHNADAGLTMTTRPPAPPPPLVPDVSDSDADAVVPPHV